MPQPGSALQAKIGPEAGLAEATEELYRTHSTTSNAVPNPSTRQRASSPHVHRVASVVSYTVSGTHNTEGRTRAGTPGSVYGQGYVEHRHRTSSPQGSQVTVQVCRSLCSTILLSFTATYLFQRSHKWAFTYDCLYCIISPSKQPCPLHAAKVWSEVSFESPATALRRTKVDAPHGQPSERLVALQDRLTEQSCLAQRPRARLLLEHCRHEAQCHIKAAHGCTSWIACRSPWQVRRTSLAATACRKTHRKSPLMRPTLNNPLPLCNKPLHRILEQLSHLLPAHTHLCHRLLSQHPGKDQRVC